VAALPLLLSGATVHRRVTQDLSLNIFSPNGEKPAEVDYSTTLIQGNAGVRVTFTFDILMLSLVFSARARG
jgi:hypothetical protein